MPVQRKDWSLIGAIRDFFNYPEGSLQALRQDFQKLSDEDKLELQVGLIRAGYNIVERNPASVTAIRPVIQPDDESIHVKQEEPKLVLDDLHPVAAPA